MVYNWPYGDISAWCFTLSRLQKFSERTAHERQGNMIIMTASLHILLCRLIHLSTLLLEHFRHLLHASVHRFFFIDIVLLSVLSELLSDTH